MKTILITGCSSGFGLETARCFHDRDWNVIATMRTPREDVLPRSEHLRVLPLDVTNAVSIRQAMETAGPIDVLVNNAGIGWLNALEGTPIDIAREVFETNTLGTMAVTQAVLPQFRERKAGVIVNVTSSVTLKPLPLLSVYTASKAAVNAFTESLALELQAFNVRVRLVIPGLAPETRFGENAWPRIQRQGGFPEAYSALAQSVVARMTEHPAAITRSTDVAEAVWRAANDPSCPMRLAAGADAVALAESLAAVPSR
ncbi:MAG: SDR family oxidoreductase [Steroidobacteraceae bacterium]